MGRNKLSKTQRVINAFEAGKTVTWKTLRNTFDLTSPQPTQAIINAGVGAVLMNGKADKTIIAAGIKALYGNGVGYAS